MSIQSFSTTVVLRNGSAEHHVDCRVMDVDRERVLVLFGESHNPVVMHYEASELRSLEVRWPEEGEG